jgi:hypothetical protein
VKAKARESRGALAYASSPILLTAKEKACFEGLEKDYQKVSDVVEE